MATFFWNTSNLSGNWSSPESWFELGTPDSGSEVVLAGTGPYTATVDVPFTVTSVTMATRGVTLDVAATLAVSSALTVGTGAEVSLAGLLVASTLDLSGGGTLSAAGGTLEGGALLGQFTTLAGAGAITNEGSIGWSASGTGAIGIAAATFDNTGVMVLTPITQAETEAVVTGVTIDHVGHPMAITSELSWLQMLAANVDVTAGNFVNSGRIELDGGSLSITGPSFTNSGDIQLLGVSFNGLVETGVVDGYTIYDTAETTLFTTVTIGAGVSYDNAGTITAGSVVFAQGMTLSQLGGIDGGLTFEAGLDLGGGTLAAQTVSVAGLVQDGSIGGGGTLTLQTGTLQTGTTLDNVAIGTLETVLEGGAGPITIVDPPSTGAAVTLDAVIKELEFQTVSTFDGSIVLGTGASADAVDVATPGGVTLGPGFSLTNAMPGSLLTIGGPGTVLNDGTWTFDGSSLDLKTTLDNAAAISLSNSATGEISVLDGGGALNVASGALVQVDTLAPGAAPSVAFGSGTAQVNLPGTGAIGAVLSGLALGDVVDFVQVSSTPNPTIFVQSTAVVADGSLDLTGASGDQASVAVAGSVGSVNFTLIPDGRGGTAVEVGCYVAGTRLATEDGEASVETLRPGDRLRTREGRLAPVRWVGWTRVDLSRHPAAARAAPIRIRADAFAPGQPRRDLLVSAEHCLWIAGALVPAAALVNGATIARLDGLSAVTYWHVELDRHDVLLAEGLPAESFLDTGNRALFAGEAGVRALHPEFAGAPDVAALAVWAAHGCAPLRVTAPEHRAALRARAEALGWRQSDDAGIAALADGVAAPWASSAGGIAVRLPAGTRRVRLRSRGFVPAELAADSGDTRRLGLAVALASIGGWKLPAAALREGWHAAAGEAWRWTDGDAELLPPKLTRPGVLQVRLHRLGRYWQAPGEAAGTRPARPDEVAAKRASA
jgi:hypothetical protein